MYIVQHKDTTERRNYAASVPWLYRDVVTAISKGLMKVSAVLEATSPEDLAPPRSTDRSLYSRRRWSTFSVARSFPMAWKSHVGCRLLFVEPWDRIVTFETAWIRFSL